jgi:4-hydroxybenzoate polyprenyltransferase
LAGWWISRGGDAFHFALLCLGATFLYLGGMFLNDAFDVAFDRQFRSERPIPSGTISVEAVWQWGFSWLGLGLLCLTFLGIKCALLGLLLAGCIVLYDAVHKLFALAPVLMALCRFLLIVLAAASAHDGVTGLSLWTALVLACYIVGLSYLARRESTPGLLQYWPILGLIAPLVLAAIINRGSYLGEGLLLSGILFVWLVRCIYLIYRKDHPNVGRAVGGLLAGIVLVDLLAILGGSAPLAVALVLLFLLALAAQRFVPAT